MTVDVKKYREEQLKMSVEEVAGHLDFDFEDVAYMEEIGVYSSEFIQEFCGHFNVNPLELRKDRVVKKKEQEKIQLNDWKAIEDYKDTLLNQLNGYTKEMSKLKRQVESDFLVSQYTATLGSLKEVQNAIKLTLRKPTIAIVGMSDAGKSTLINHLLQAKKMPVSWTPTTSIGVIIKHINDRPAFLKEELVILGGQKTLFKVENLDNETYVKKYILTEGNANLLHDYGTRQGNQMTEATHAILYLDSELLKVCDFVDLPGFGTGESKDDKLAQQSYKFADIVIYLSVANGFLRGNDIEFIKTSLQSLNPLENKTNDLANLRNFYVLASQAHTVNYGNREDLQMILDKGTERLYHEIPLEVWEQREQMTGQVVEEGHMRDRFFTFTTDSKYLSRDFENDLYSLLKEIPKLVLEKGQKLISSMVFASRDELVKQLDGIHGTMTKYEEMLGKYTERKNKDGTRIQKVLLGRERLFDGLHEKEIASIQQFKSEYGAVLSEQNIIDIIDKNNYKKKKADLERLVSYISTQLQTRLQTILSGQSQQFQQDIEQFLEEYDKAIPITSNAEVSNIGFQFNTKAIFAGAVAGLGTLGALSIWAASFGNLGAYILVAKGVSLLSAVGISVGGTAAATAGVAAIGGPIVLGIAIAAILGVGVWKLFSGGWKKDIVKTLNKQFEKQGVLNKLLAEIENFWETTREEVTNSIEELETEYRKMLDDVEANLNSDNFEELPKKKAIIEMNLEAYDKLLDKI